MNNKAIMPVFAATLFISAFLIFSVQPMVSKMLLPMLGGSPSVWNTAMVFFQAILLAGYSYAHLSARYLSFKAQALTHLGLLCLFTLVLPIFIPETSTPPEHGGQALWQIGVMLIAVGGPFFVLAASAPLFQHWFSQSEHKDAENPYFLYAVSNTGSMSSLLLYPTVIEPFLGLHNQTIAWYWGYIGLIILTALCTYLLRHQKQKVKALLEDQVPQHLTFKNKAFWILLSFIPSSLMLGVTTFISTDLASAPFLWIIPLALYLATFIIAFSTKPCIPIVLCREATPYILCFLILTFLMSSFVLLTTAMILINLIAFFMCSQLCHGELARLKPSTKHLTEYFLLISFGGVLGGVFNAILAPMIFLMPIEYPATLSLVSFVIWFITRPETIITKAFNAHDKRRHYNGLLIMDLIIITLGGLMFFYILSTQNDLVQIFGGIAVFLFLFVTVPKRFIFACSSLIALLLFQPGMWSDEKKLISIDRNYFGVLRVYSKENTNFFYHGTTLHGAQIQTEDHKLTPVTYYNPDGPASDIFSITSQLKKQKVAGLGLGVGSIACYKNSGREFDFYEIDPDVVRIAEDNTYFSYLSDCGSPYKIIVGDARLKMQNAPDDYYDLIFIDTFSSDNIPVHIMSKEAFTLYLKKLSNGGLIAMNISNRYLDLRPVLSSIARDLGMTVYFKVHTPIKNETFASQLYTTSIFAVMAKSPITIADFVEQYDWTQYNPTQKSPKPWTDDYANIIGSLASGQ